MNKTGRTDLIDEILTQKLDEPGRSEKGVNVVSVLLFFMLIFFVSFILISYIALKTSENVEKNEQAQHLRICSTYINMVLRQNDRLDCVELLNLDGDFADYKGLLIRKFAGEDDLNLAIFYKDKTLYELIFKDRFEPALAEKIVEIEDFEVSKNGNLIRLEISSKTKTVERFIALRTGS